MRRLDTDFPWGSYMPNTQKKNPPWVDYGKYNPPKQSSEHANAALISAIDLLEPFPWPLKRRSKFTYQPFDIAAWPFDRESAAGLCWEIATNYQNRLHQEAEGLRPTRLFERFETIASLCFNLSEKIDRLSSIERELLNGTLEFKNPWAIFGGKLAESQSNARGRITNKIQSLLPETRSFDGTRLEAGLLVRQLHDFATHFRQVVRETKTDFRFSKVNDKGGKTSLRSLFSASPQWRLIHDCWTLFAASKHLKPSTYMLGPLLKFLGCIHEYATHENVSGRSRFESPLREYSTVRQEHDSKLAELLQIVKTTKYLMLPSINYLRNRDVLSRAFSGSKKLQRVLDLSDQLDEVSLIIIYGPLIAKRLALQNSSRRQSNHTDL